MGLVSETSRKCTRKAPPKFQCYTQVRHIIIPSLSTLCWHCGVKSSSPHWDSEMVWPIGDVLIVWLRCPVNLCVSSYLFMILYSDNMMIALRNMSDGRYKLQNRSACCRSEQAHFLEALEVLDQPHYEQCLAWATPFGFGTWNWSETMGKPAKLVISFHMNW